MAICWALTSIVGGALGIYAASADSTNGSEVSLDRELTRALERAGFTGRIESTLETRLGRPIDAPRANLGRMLFFDKILGLHDDNSCAGCHSPAFGFGDSQRMAIGVQNNGIVGPHRMGPRNQRRSPLASNTIFYPALMWTPRFTAISGDPFNSPLGFKFPPPENIVTGMPTLLSAQGSLPSTELVEMAGFSGIAANPGPFGPRHYQFDDGLGQALPAPDETGFHNFPIQAVVNARLNAVPAYLDLFARAFNGGVPLAPGGITIEMRRLAVAEFQASLTAADAPLDHYARGETWALTDAQKRGALLFFGRARCVSCHAVSGKSNEMFSDFSAHRIGGPQVAPAFGIGAGDTIFDGPGEDEDFGFEQTEGDSAKRYMFRTAPLRNLRVAPGFFHNGAFGSLEAAIAHHLDPEDSLRHYDPVANDLPSDLHVGPFMGILKSGIDPLLRGQIKLSDREFQDLVDFVRNGLFDPKVEEFCNRIPAAVPSGRPLQVFEGCP
ncbi:MAG TPA: cytochrome c peroxidase [Candidatus Polarisedimenticolia bacterium]|nr:cytochrome c peroxidase [Candidatus Polarisedimenticolia bacterium]